MRQSKSSGRSRINSGTLGVRSAHLKELRKRTDSMKYPQEKFSITSFRFLVEKVICYDEECVEFYFYNGDMVKVKKSEILFKDKVKCAYCGKEFIPQTERARGYCTHECFTRHQFKHHENSKAKKKEPSE